MLFKIQDWFWNISDVEQGGDGGGGNQEDAGGTRGFYPPTPQGLLNCQKIVFISLCVAL